MTDMGGFLFYTGATSFGIGIFLRSLFELSSEVVTVSLVVSFAFAALWSRARSTLFLAGSISLLLLSLGMLRVDVTMWQEPSLTALENQEVTLEGVVLREPDVRESNQHLYVRDSASDELVLVTTDKFLNVSYGDAVRVSGTLEVPEAFETDLGRTFNYPGYLRARGVSHMVSFADVEVMGHGEGNPVRSSLFTLKHWFMGELETLVPEPAAGLGEGLLLGVKRALGENLDTVFRRAGIIHIVVLSGYNVMIVAEAIMRLLSFAFMPRVRLIIGVVAISAFAIMVGLGATVVRASIMAVFVLIARATGRTTAILRTLTLAGIVMLLINPYLLAFDPGFQLSFLATLGLILVAPHIERALHMVQTKYQVREFVVATIATQIMVLPLLLYLMGQLSVVAVVVNVLVLPVVPFAMGLTFAAGMVGAVTPALGAAVGLFATLLLNYIVYVATFFAALPFAAFAVPAFPFVLVVLLYVLLGYSLWRVSLRETKERQTDQTSDFSDWEIVTLEGVKSGVNPKGPAAGEAAGPSTFPFR